MYLGYTQDKSFAKVLNTTTVNHIMNNITPRWGTFNAVPYGNGSLITKTFKGNVWYVYSIN
jgi:hypothetical protein